jgi:hypothetical protein
MFALRRPETMEGLRHFLTPYRCLAFSCLGKFGSEFLRHSLLQLFRVHSVAFGWQELFLSKIVVLVAIPRWKSPSLPT